MRGPAGDLWPEVEGHWKKALGFGIQDLVDSRFRGNEKIHKRGRLCYLYSNLDSGLRRDYIEMGGRRPPPQRQR